MKSTTLGTVGVSCGMNWRTMDKKKKSYTYQAKAWDFPDTSRAPIRYTGDINLPGGFSSLRDCRKNALCWLVRRLHEAMQSSPQLVDEIRNYNTGNIKIYRWDQNEGSGSTDKVYGFSSDVFNRETFTTVANGLGPEDLGLDDELYSLVATDFPLNSNTGLSARFTVSRNSDGKHFTCTVKIPVHEWVEAKQHKSKKLFTDSP